ncbi:MAG: DUF2927 domain-containing protein [Pseudomonadota bacterium]
MIRAWLTLAAWVLGAHLAAAQDYIETNGRLSDDDFYLLVACGAPPGDPCQDDIVRWSPSSARNITIGITRIDDSFPRRNARLIRTALTTAGQEIAALDAGVAFTTTDQSPDIQVLLMSHPENSELRGTGIPGLDGNFIEAARFQIWWDGNRHIRRGVIIITQHIRPRDIQSVMLEEMVQSLGLTVDIRNPSYATSSIFSQDSNTVTRLQGQDAMAVRRHYRTQRNR